MSWINLVVGGICFILGTHFYDGELIDAINITLGIVNFLIFLKFDA